LKISIKYLEINGGAKRNIILEARYRDQFEFEFIQGSELKSANIRFA